MNHRWWRRIGSRKSRECWWLGKGAGLDIVVEQLAEVQSAAAVSLSAQHWHFLAEHPPL